jgi:DNA-binding XRE family transcriptional regulator
MTSLGTAIRALRARVGLSQEGLATLVGLSQGQISRIERDRSEVVRPQLLVRLASVLGVAPSELLPDTTPWRSEPHGDVVPVDVFRVGYWESVWTAPVIGVSTDPPTLIRMASRGRVESLFTAIHPDAQDDPRSRPLTPRELVRALRAGYFAAVLIPDEILAEHQNELVECAQVGLAVDGVHVAVCMNRSDAVMDGFDGTVATAEASSWAHTAWDHVRSAAVASPIPIYFPTDVGAVDTAHRIRESLGGRVEVHAVAPEQWPTFWDTVGDPAGPGGRPVIAVAAEPYLEAWRQAVWQSNRNLTTIPVDAREIWPDAAPAMSYLSLCLHTDRCEEWLKNPAVYSFLEAVEQQAEGIRRRTSRALPAIMERLQLDVPSIIRECERCDFTTRFAPSWVARLRGHLGTGAG